MKKRNLAIIKCDADLPVYHGNTEPLHLIFSEFFQSDQYNVTFYDAVKHQLPDATAYDAIVLTGSKFSATDDFPWIKHLVKFIQARNYKKLIGICFGHQIVAQSLGGRVAKVDWHIGVKHVELVFEPNWLEPKQDVVQCRFNHQDQVLDIPADATLMASNNYCSTAMYYMGEQILCMQFHPEYTEDFHMHIFGRYREQFSERLQQDIEADIKKPTQHDIIYKWIDRFLG